MHPHPVSPSRQRGLGVSPSSAWRSVTGEERGAFPPCVVSCPPTGQHLTPPHQWTAGDDREQSTALGSPHCGEVQLWGARGAWGAMKAALRSWGSWGLVSMIPGGWGAGMQGWVCPGSREALDWVWPGKEAPPISGRPTAKGPAWICPPALQSQGLGFSPSGTPALPCTSVLLGFKGQDCGRCTPCQACMERPGLSPVPPPSLSSASNDQRRPGQLRSLRRVLEAGQGRGLHCIFIPISTHHSPHRTPFHPFRSTG